MDLRGRGCRRIHYTSATSATAVTMRFEQVGELIFDVPVTVTITYTDGRTQDVVVPVTERLVERMIPTDGRVRMVRINQDYAAVAEFDER